MYELTGGYPYFVQAYGKAVWDVAPRSPITPADVAVAAPEAEAELARRLLRLALRAGDAGRAGVPARDGRARRRPTTRSATAAVADALGRPPQSLSPARDGLLKKGLVYSGQRGRIAFTVPHFGRYLRAQDVTGLRAGRPACWRIQACIAMPAATPALIERVEPYCAIEQTALATSHASAERPVPSWPNSSSALRGRSKVSSGTAPGRLSIAMTS